VFWGAVWLNLSVFEDRRRVKHYRWRRPNVDKAGLGLDDGGTQAAFDKAAYDKAMKGVRHEYECSENFFKHDSVFSARARIPVITARVDDIMNTRYSTPCPFGRPMIISVIDETWEAFRPGHFIQVRLPCG
jgi:hypothetical protein